jgi:hypothetical protein
MLSLPWLDYDPRQVGLASATLSVVTMLDTGNSNRKRTFVKLTSADTGWNEIQVPQFLVMTSFKGVLDYDPSVVGLAGSVGDVWLGPSQGVVCYFEKAGTGDTEWARISEYSGGAPAVQGSSGALTLTDQGWATLPAFTSLASGLVPASGGGTGNFLRADSRWAPPTVRKSNTADVVANAADTYLADSVLQLPVGTTPSAGLVMHWRLAMSKTAAGVAAPTWIVRAGVNGSTADAALVTLTGAAQTANAATGYADVVAHLRVAGASGVLVASINLVNGGNTLGFSTRPSFTVDGVSGAFDTTVANLKFGLSVNPGASGVWTHQLIQSEMRYT